MPIKRPRLVNDEIYHVVVRGAGDSRIFHNKGDYFRAVFSLYEFNDSAPVIIRDRRKLRNKSKTTRERFSGNSSKRDLFVDILAFCFMQNHLHLLLKQLADDGISKFMRKLGAGYVGYFNKKYTRKGPLFAKFRAVHIKTDAQLKIVFSYIHTNPIALIEPGWKNFGIKNSEKAIRFLEDYKWSSYLDYIGKRNFPSVTERDIFLQLIGDERACRNFVVDWIKYKSTEDFSGEIALE
ncbi:MAG: transposase [bacterium]|nr:transposase [bacterium]